MIQALAIGRVSSKHQAENNHSLDAQRNSINRMAEKMDLEIVFRWEMAISSKKGKNLKRTDLSEAKEMCRQNKNIKYILLDRVNRLGREVKFLTWYKLDLEIKYGVQLIFCDPLQQVLNGTDLESFKKFINKLVEAEEENEEKAQLNRARMRERFELGYFPFPVKLGYRSSNTPGLHVPSEPAFTIMQEAMKSIVSGTRDARQALKWATDKGLRTPQGNNIDLYRWMKVLKQPYYSGYVSVNGWGVVKGLHRTMISPEEFEILQMRIQNIKTRHRSTAHFNPYYLLQTIVSCGICGGVKRITGSTSNNGHGGKQERYYCMDCKKYQQRKKVHSGLKKLLSRVRLPKENRETLIEALEIVWKEKEGDTSAAIKSLQKRRNELLEKKSKLISLCATAPEAMVGDIAHEVEQVKSSITELDADIFSLEDGDKDMIEFIRFAINYVNELVENFWSLTKDDLLWCQKLLFPGEIILYENGIFGTNRISPIIRLAKPKKDLLKGPLSQMVEMAGIAPASDE